MESLKRREETHAEEEQVGYTTDSVWCRDQDSNHIHFIVRCTKSKVKVRAPFSIATTPRYKEGHYSFL